MGIRVGKMYAQWSKKSQKQSFSQWDYSKYARVNPFTFILFSPCLFSVRMNNVHVL